MIVGIDYDGTWTLDPFAWAQVVSSLHLQGHKCLIVTQRCAELGDDVIMSVNHHFGPMMIIFASGKTKEDAAREAGYNVDVWIDNEPFSVSTARKYRGCP